MLRNLLKIIFIDFFVTDKISCGRYYKPITIINDDSSIVNKLEPSLTDDARVIIYNHHMFIVQATGLHSEDRLNGRGSAVNRTIDGSTYPG
jgi:hypothetical protein